jgi:hypothetical protein
MSSCHHGHSCSLASCLWCGAELGYNILVLQYIAIYCNTIAILLVIILLLVRSIIIILLLVGSYYYYIIIVD